jgi:hypothetical protein
LASARTHPSSAWSMPCSCGRSLIRMRNGRSRPSPAPAARRTGAPGAGSIRSFRSAT